MKFDLKMKYKHKKLYNYMILILKKKGEQIKLTLEVKPLIKTEFLANSDISQELNFQTCAAILNSSINGSKSSNRSKIKTNLI